MDEGYSRKKAIHMRRLGNFTRHVVETFEKNIVEQKDYLEKIKED
jgi:hypothetical protein